jgi:hypothetical protein
MVGMHFVFKKVTHFSRLLKAGGRLREFNFRKLTDQTDGDWFHVDVADERGDRIIFRLSTSLKAASASLPPWVIEVWPQLLDVATGDHEE